MSDDLIRRSDAIKAVENVSENYTKEGDREWHPHIDFITQALVQVPSVSPKQGEWITIDAEVISVPVYWNEEQRQSDERGAGILEKCKCSVCGWRKSFMGYKKLGVNKSYNYCPNCGAKMDEERKGKCKECWYWSEVYKRCENKCGCQFKPYEERKESER